MSEIQVLDFHGDRILLVDEGGKPHIVVKPALDTIGLDYWAQVRKLRERSWATTAFKAVVAADGRTREMLTCDVRTFLMLLATVDERRVGADVAPKLVAYQAEVADAIEAYWTVGGAINPRATDSQLDKLNDLIEERRAVRARRRIELLNLMGPFIDPGWRESRLRHEYALVVGEQPDIPPEDRALMVEPYLIDRGLPRAGLRSVRSIFGKRLKELYVRERGVEPAKALGIVDGRERPITYYTERDRPLFDQIWERHFADRFGNRTGGEPG